MRCATDRRGATTLGPLIVGTATLKSRAWWLRVIGIIAPLLLTACRTTTPPTQVQPASATPSGTASYEVVLDASPDVSKQVSQRLFLPAAPVDENGPPLYPEALLSLGLPPQRLVVRLALDEHGQITDVTTNASASEADPRYQAVFEAAIRTAVECWRFKAATQRVFVDSPPDGSGKPPYKMLKAEILVPTYFDMRFIFEVTDGEGAVRQVQ